MEERTREDIVKEELNDYFRTILEKDYVPFKAEGGHNPRLYDTPKKLVKEMIRYLLPKMVANQPISIRGFLNKSQMVTPRTFYDYQTYGPDYKRAINLLQGIVEEAYHDSLFSINFNGAKFALQCGFKEWIPKEHQIIEQKDFIVNIGNATYNHDKENKDESTGTDISEDEETNGL